MSKSTVSIAGTAGHVGRRKTDPCIGKQVAALQPPKHSEGRKSGRRLAPQVGLFLAAALPLLLSSVEPSLSIDGFALRSNVALAAETDQQSSAANMSSEAQREVISNYCLDCHNYSDNAGGLSLVLFEPGDADQEFEISEKIIRKLRAGMMPPAGKPRPDFHTEQALAAELEKTVDAHVDYHPAKVGLHRLNRVEYANVIRDLLALDIDTSELLPVDDSNNGFDNQAGTLGLSPVLLEAYLSSAGKIARLAIGDISTPSQTVYRIPEDTSQNEHVEGLPFGTRGGILTNHTFPADGRYQLNIFAVNLGNMGNFRPFGEVRGEKLEVLIDGKRVGLFDWDKEFGVGEELPKEERGQLRSIELEIPVTAGSHEVGITFLASNYAPGLDLNNAFKRTTIETGGLPGFTFYPHVGSVRFEGPFDASGAHDTASRNAIFACVPDNAKQERTCAKKTVERLARRAYRGFDTPEDVTTLMQFYEEGRAGGSFDDGIEMVLQRLLTDPKFIYRVESAPRDVKAGEVYKLDGRELASRLSFFLWSSIPDDELLDLAINGKLEEPAVFKAQVLRMLADPRSKELTRNFAGQWLALRNLSGHAPVIEAFPDFDNNLRVDFRQEMELFFDSIIRENRPATDLLTANYTFVNGRLADYYGIKGIEGSHFRRVELDEDHDVRRGILGKGSLLTVTSQPGRTSPVIRGNWALTNIIGVPAPPPPPNVPAIETKVSDAAGNVRPPSIREQYEAHRSNPACMGCHKMMDPIGFSLEVFDATGRWRTEDSGNPINSSDVMYDGSPVNGPADLRNFFMKYKVQFVRTIAEKLLTYATGRGMSDEDMPVVRAVTQEAANDDYRFQSLILAVTQSDAFRMSTKAQSTQQARVED